MRGFRKGLQVNFHRTWRVQEKPCYEDRKIEELMGEDVVKTYVAVNKVSHRLMIVPFSEPSLSPCLQGHCRSKWVRLFSFSASRVFLRLRRSLPAGSLVDARLLAGG